MLVSFCVHVTLSFNTLSFCVTLSLDFQLMLVSFCVHVTLSFITLSFCNYPSTHPLPYVHITYWSILHYTSILCTCPTSSLHLTSIIKSLFCTFLPFFHHTFILPILLSIHSFFHYSHPVCIPYFLSFKIVTFLTYSLQPHSVYISYIIFIPFFHHTFIQCT